MRSIVADAVRRPQTGEPLRLLLLGWMIGSGSTGVYARELAEYLSAAGQSVTCLSAGKCDWWFKPHLVVAQRLPFELVELRNPPIVSCARPRKPEAEIDSPQTIRLLRRVLAETKPEIVVVLDFPGWPADIVKVCQETGSKVVIVSHNFWPFCSRLALVDRWGNVCRDYQDGARCVECMANVASASAVRWRSRIPAGLWRYARQIRSVKRFYRACVRGTYAVSAPDRTSYAARRQAYVRAIQRSDLLCCISRRTEELMAAFGIQCPKTVITPITLLHMKSIHAACASREPSLRHPRRPVRFAYIGQSDPIKGTGTLIEAFRGFPRHEATLDCYGGGDVDYLVQLRRAGDRENPPVFHGPYRQSELRSILANVDVGIVPSICEDTRPNTILEFQAAGVPVIGSRIGGIPEQIEHERNGLLFTAGDAVALRAAMDMVIRTPQMIKIWRSNLPTTFDPEPSWRQMEQAFRELAGRS